MSPIRSFRLSATIASIALAILVCSNADASVNFAVGGLNGTGVSAGVGFAYTSYNNNLATLTITIENTSTVGGKISGFAFNVPTISGVAFSSIGGTTANGAAGLFSRPYAGRAEGYSAHQYGWLRKWSPSNIADPGGAGDFDFAVFTNHDRSPGKGSGSRISSSSIHDDTTSIVLRLTGSGLQSLNAASFESAFMSELSTGDEGHYSFALNFSDIGSNHAADTAVAMSQSSVNQVPVPGALALALIGLGFAGLVGRRRARR